MSAQEEEEELDEEFDEGEKEEENDVCEGDGGGETNVKGTSYTSLANRTIF